MNILLGVSLLVVLVAKIAADDNVLNLTPEQQAELTSHLQKGEDLLKEKCRKNSNGEEAYPIAKQGVIDAGTCVTKFVSVEEVRRDIEEKKKTGDLDVVFGKYCRKKSDLLSCATNLKKAVSPCLEDDEKRTANTAINITSSLLDFACFRDGDRLALFIAEGGPECFNKSAIQVKTCVENTFDLKLNLDENGKIPQIDKLPNLAITTERCDKFTTLQTCVVKELEKCSETTPANIVEALFNFIRKRSPCHKN